MPSWTPPTEEIPKWNCRVHPETRQVYTVTLRNDDGEIVYQHTYCLQCYDIFLQRNLDLLNPVKNYQEKRPI